MLPGPNDLWRGNIYDAVALWFSDEGSAVEFYGPISAWDTARVTSLEGLFCDWRQQTYTLVSSGTCQSNNRYEVPQADCETAAMSLGLDDLDATVEVTIWSNVANGCIHSSAQSTTAFVTNSVSNDCGTYGYDCICADNAGSVSPSFSFVHHVLGCSWPRFF